MAKVRKVKGKKLVLSIGDEGAILTLVDNGVMTNRLFVASPTATDFVSLIASAPEAPIAIYVDVVDQAYTQHTLPPVSKMNVKKLIERKLEKEYDPSDLKSAILLGREETLRRDWKYLFVSVRNIPPLSDWIESIVGLPNKFEGIFLLPVESMSFMEDLKVAMKDLTPNPSSWQILISHNRIGGFRQVIYRDNKILFTRIAQPIGGQTPDIVAGNIEQETLNTIEYIRRLGFEDKSGLDLYIIVADEVKKSLDINVHTSNPPVIITPAKAAEGLGIPSAAEAKDRFGDVLMATHFAVTKKHHLKFSTDTANTVSTLENLSSAVVYATAAISIGLVGYTLYNVKEFLSVNDDINIKEVRKISAQKKLNDAKKLFEDFDGNVEQIKEISKLHEDFNKDKDQIFDFFKLYASAEGYNISTKSFDAKIEKREDNPDKISADISMVLATDGTVKSNIAASLIETFIDLEKYFKTLFKGYEVTFSDRPSENTEIVNIPDEKATNLNFELPLKIEGPIVEETNKRGRAKKSRGRRR